MKKTLFSKGLYAETMRRLRVVGFIALALFLIIQTAPILVQVVDYLSYVENPDDYYSSYGIGVTRYEAATVNFSEIFISLPIASYIFTPIMMLIAFSVFNKRPSSDFYHSLPYTRPCIYISFISAVYTWIAGICIICSLVGYVSMASLPMLFHITYDGAATIFLSYVAIALLGGGAVALACTLTGTFFSNIAVSGLILFLPRFIITIMSSWISSAADFLYLSYAGESFFAPTFNLYFGGVASSLFYMTSDTKAIVPIIYTSVLGVIYLALGLVGFVKRKSETATNPAANRLTQHIIRILLTMAIAIFSVLLVLEGEIAGSIVVFLIALTAYFAYELITTKRWKNCLKAAPWLGVVVALCIICGTVMIFVPRIAAEYTPEAEDIDSVRLISENSYGYDEWFGSEAQDLELTDERIISVVAKALRDNMDAYKKHGSFYTDYIHTITDEKYDYFDSVTQTVAIKEGLTTRYRTIQFSPDQYDKIVEALNSNEEYRKACMTLPKPLAESIDFCLYEEVDPAFNMKVFNCLQEEIYKLSFEDFYNIATGNDDKVSLFSLDYYSDNYSIKYVYLPISSERFPKTFDMILEAFESVRKDREKDLDTVIERAIETSPELDGITESASLDVTLCIPEEDGSYSYYAADIYYSVYDEETGEYDVSVKDSILELIEKARAMDTKPDHNAYVFVSYSIFAPTDDYNSVDISGSIFLPLPEDFDPEAAGFGERINDNILYR